MPGEPPVPVKTPPSATTSLPVTEDPFAGVIDDAPVAKPEGKPIPETGGTVKKKSMAASLYDLDDEKAGE